MKTSIAVLLACCGIGISIASCSISEINKYKAEETNNEHSTRALRVSAEEDTTENYNVILNNEINIPTEISFTPPPLIYLPNNNQLIWYYEHTQTNNYLQLQNYFTLTDFTNRNGNIIRTGNQSIEILNNPRIQINQDNYIIQINVNSPPIENHYIINFNLLNNNTNTLLYRIKVTPQNTNYITELYDAVGTGFTYYMSGNYNLEYIGYKTYATQKIEQLQNQNNTIANLNNQIETLTANNESLQTALNNQQRQNETLQTQVNNLTNSITPLENQISGLNATINAKDNQINSLNLQIQEFERTGSTILDIPGLMLDILAMPWAFISNAFNVTIFPNTPYALNFSNVFKGLIAILTLLFIIRLFTNGFNAIGQISNNASQTELNKAKTKESLSKARLNDRTNPNKKD